MATKFIQRYVFKPWSFEKDNIFYNQKRQHTDAQQGKFSNKLYLNFRYSDIFATRCEGYCKEYANQLADFSDTSFQS